MKKRLWSVLSLMLIASLVLAACGNNNKDNNAAPSASAPASQSEAAATAEAPAADAKPVDVSVFSVQETNIDLPTNKFTKFVEEKFNIKFNLELIPSDGAKEKRQISLASGDYPDAYMLTAYIDQFSQADVLKYGKQGVLIPLNDLIDQYAPNIKAAMEANPDLKAFNTAPDGNIYGLVAYSQCFHCSYPNKMWLNTKWLDKLGLKMPTTPESSRKCSKRSKRGSERQRQERTKCR